MNDYMTDEELRREADYARVRTRNPVCHACGFDKHPAAMELAHIAPRRFHDDAVVLCANCHRIASDAEKGLPYSPSTANPTLETIARYLMHLSKLFILIAETFNKFGAQLLELAEKDLTPQAERAR
jgi:hypothetical protein